MLRLHAGVKLPPSTGNGQPRWTLHFHRSRLPAASLGIRRGSAFTAPVDDGLHSAVEERTAYGMRRIDPYAEKRCSRTG